MTNLQYTTDEAARAAEGLRWWFKLDTWTLREGLLLLAGIDPHHSECIVMDDAGGFTADPLQWSRIGFPPGGTWVDGAGPVVTGVYFNPEEALRLWELSSLWHSVAGHEGMTRATPEHFITWAESKQLAPWWLDAARSKGIAPAAPAPAPQTAPETVSARQARFLGMFEAEEKREKLGAMARAAKQAGVDRSNFGKDVKKAREARTESRRSGVFVSQLVRDGKR